MGFKTLLLVTLFSVSGSAFSQSPVHQDVDTFVKNADECEHQAGEWDSDLEKAEKKRIEAAIVKYCSTAKKQLHTLTKKYKNDTGIQKVLVDHSYDSVKDFEK